CFDQALGDNGNWVRIPRALAVLFGTVMFDVTVVVSPQPGNPAFNQDRASPLPRPLSRLSHRIANSDRIGSVDCEAGHSISGGALSDTANLDCFGGRCHLRPAIVLADNQHGQVASRGI